MPHESPLPAVTTPLSAAVYPRSAAMHTPIPQPPSALEAKLVILGAQGVGKTSLVNRFLDPRAPLSVQPTIGASFITKIIHDADSNTTVRLQIWDTAGQERFHSISKLYYRNAHAGILCYDVTSEASWLEMQRWLEEIRQNCELDFEENKPGAGMVIHVVGTKLDLVADDPNKKQVPFERTIAYVAEHLVAGGARNTSTVSQSSSSTPPLAIRQINVHQNTLQHAKSPDSKRSSGLWYQDAGWDSCHEVSAKDNDGIEEIFRVISKRLIDQRAKREAYELAQTPLNNSLGAGGDYFSSGRSGSAGARSGGGSFRLGHGHRRSWLGLPTFNVTGLGLQYDEPERVDANGNYIKDPEEARRRGRCC